MSAPKSFWQQLPRSARWLLSVVAVHFIGFGMSGPFWFIYFHEVRDFSKTTTGFLIGWAALSAFLASFPAGHWIDKFGPKRVMIAAIGLIVTAQFCLISASQFWIALLAQTLAGMAIGMDWPAATALVNQIIPSEIRQKYFGINFTMINLGVGIGGLIGAVVVDPNNLRTFQFIYLGEAICYLPTLFVLLFLVKIPATQNLNSAKEISHTTYRQLLKQADVRALVLLNFLMSFVGYSQLESGFAAYARYFGKVSTETLGIAFAVNTLVIVCFQIFVLRLIEKRKRTAVLQVMGLIWLVSWLVLGLSGLFPNRPLAAGLAIISAAIFAIGEMLMQPVAPAITNDSAPAHLIGKYNGLTAASYQLAAIVGPFIAGALIDAELPLVYIGMLVVGILVQALVIRFAIESRLTPVANGLDFSHEKRNQKSKQGDKPQKASEN